MGKQHIIASAAADKRTASRISVVVDPGLKAELQRIADAECRTLSGQVLLYLQRGIHQRQGEGNAQDVAV